MPPWGPRVSLLVPLAAVLLIVVLAGAFLMSGLRTATPGPGASASLTADPSAVATPVATTQGSAPATPSTSLGVTTRGVTSAWTGFTWQEAPDGDPVELFGDPYSPRDLVGWDHGYAALGKGFDGPNVLLTSPDGATWTQITAVRDPDCIASGPDGLVAVDTDGDRIWTSTDGTQWHDAGRPSGVSTIQSIAGTAAGLVAAGLVSTDTSGVVFSADGVSWTPIALELTAVGDYLGVYAGQGRFFVVAGSSAIGEGGMWWSDDGRTWARSSWAGFAVGGIPEIEFASGGMLSWTTPGIAEMAVEMEVSHDGGKTWLKDPDFGPLGALGKCPDTATCGSDGYIGSNGSIFLAVNNVGVAWTSSDGIVWKQIQWNRPDWGASGRHKFIVLPRGVIAGTQGQDLSYGSATDRP